jgi:quercetin 2,3-dioxygenase
MTAQNRNTVIDKSRNVIRTVRGSETSDGAGVRLRRYIASPELDMLDPFLLLDVFRSDNPTDYIAGFPPHPHRGFETVTYLLHGNMRHRDSTGREGVIRSGGVQWMTAGSGIEHSEMPEQVQGMLSGFQLWVNLPASEKMRPPRYQEFEPDEVPIEIRDSGARVHVVAGDTLEGTTGAVSDIAAAPLYLDVELPSGASFIERVPAGHNAFMYVIEGDIDVIADHDRMRASAKSLLVLGDGDGVEIQATTGARFLLVAGKPFNEPIARYGPFVMNTQQEIQQAFADYRAGKFGHVHEGPAQ